MKSLISIKFCICPETKPTANDKENEEAPKVVIHEPKIQVLK